MKCAFVNLGKHYGGAEQYLQTIIKSWLDNGNEAIVIVRYDSELCKNIRKIMPGLSVIEVGFDVKSIFAVKKILKSDKVDIIHINGINSGVFINLIHSNVPKITTVHSNADLDRAEKPYFVRKIFVWIENYCLKKSDAIIAVSEIIKKLLVSRNILENSITVINNGVKYIEYPQKKWKNILAEPLKICFAGRLEKVKGCEYLIRAVALLKTECRIQCDIYGSGSQKQELINICKEFQVDEIINFKGFCNRIREILPQYDVIVMPSLYEASPLTIPEAMNAKTLLVCSDVGGIPYMIKDGVNGFLYERGNVDELSQIIRNIYFGNCDYNMILNNAYNDFIKQYTEDSMIKKTFSVLMSCK